MKDSIKEIKESAAEETRRRFSHLSGQRVRIWTTHNLHLLPAGIDGPIAAEHEGVFRECLGSGFHYMFRLTLTNGEEMLIPVGHIWLLETVGYVEQEKEARTSVPVETKVIGRPAVYSMEDIEPFLSTDKGKLRIEVYNDYKAETGKRAMSERTFNDVWAELQSSGRIQKIAGLQWIKA